jgi:hypothetical protein
MRSRIRSWARRNVRGGGVFPVAGIVLFFFVLFLFLCLFVPIKGHHLPWLYVGLALLLLYLFRPGSALYAPTMEDPPAHKTLLLGAVLAIVIAACTLPMSLVPYWNGENPEWRNQYELMADAILEGHVDLQYGDDAELAQLENPYDPVARSEAGVTYHWDHAYYNGHYYMYFGVVPVFLVFLPYRVLTGSSLTTYHGTQIFVALAIVGIFCLFYLLAKLFFKRLPYIVYLACSAAFAIMSVWYGTAEPALYCTAIASALALEIWSLYFFIRAVHYETRENRQIAFAAVGALLGALAFGCRPPVALTNILVLPLLVTFLKQHKRTPKLFAKLFLAALPYFVVGALLMLYNYVRFNDPFEFGQSYQLTVADQTNLGISLSASMLKRVVKNGFTSLFAPGSFSSGFPYLNSGGVCFNFPILLLCLCVPFIAKQLHKRGFLAFVLCLFFTVAVILAFDIMWSPYLLERYHMDIYFLLGIGCFIVIGFLDHALSPTVRRYAHPLLLLSAGATAATSALFCCGRIADVSIPLIRTLAHLLDIV